MTQKMAEFDLKGSITYVTMLSETGIITKMTLQLNRAWKSSGEYKAGKLNSIFPMKIFI